MGLYRYGLILLLVSQLGLLAVVFHQHSKIKALESAQLELHGAMQGVVQANQKRDSGLESGICVGDTANEGCVNEAENESEPADVANVGVESVEDTDWRISLREKVMDQLIPFGFSAYDSERIIDIEIESLLAFREIEKATGAKAHREAYALMWQTMDRFREELGEFGFQAYLEAKGLPTRIQVRRVVKRSQAASLEMQVGDKIESYDGVRVYDIYRLNKIVREQSKLQRQGSVPIVYRRGESVLTTEVAVGSIGIHAAPLQPDTFFDAFGG